MVEIGITPRDIKETVINTLQPFFHNEDVLREYALQCLVPEAVHIGRLQEDNWAFEMFRRCLEVHLAAYAIAPEESLRAAAAWETEIAHGISEFWSEYHLEIDIEKLSLEEFKTAVFQRVGSIIEVRIQPYLRELLQLVKIRDGIALSRTQL